MLNLGKVVNTVQRNCHISDARHAGNYTMCIFLLKMREYYRWENELPLTCCLPREDVGNWLVEREQVWQQLETDSYQPVPLEHQASDPFDTETINNELVELGYVYSSGYGLFNKPHFFLGQLLRKEQRDDVTILVSSCEYARDLVAPPAMMRDNTIFVRQESVRRVVWERMEEWQFRKQPDGPLARAMACYGPQQDMESILDRMADDEVETMIQHELGEVEAGRLLGHAWEDMLIQLPRTKAEIMIRAVRDNLADCLTTLPQLLEDNNPAALHMYASNYNGMRKKLFPDMLQAYETWAREGKDSAMRQLIEYGQEHCLQQAQTILALFEQHGADGIGPVIEKLLDPEATT